MLLALAVALVACGGAGTTAAPTKPKPQAALRTPGPLALSRDGRWLFVADRDLRRLLRIDLRTRRRSVVVSGFPQAPVGLNAHYTGPVFVAAADRIYRVDGSRKSVVAGTGERGHAGDGGPARAATFGGIVGIDVDFDGNLLAAEYDNWIRVVDAAAASAPSRATGAAATPATAGAHSTRRSATRTTRSGATTGCC